MVALSAFWESARAVDEDAPTEERLFGRPEELLELWQAQGLDEVDVQALEVRAGYEDFDELWGTFLLGVGPSGEYAVSLEDGKRDAVRADYFRRLGEPPGSFTLEARAWAARGVVSE